MHKIAYFFISILFITGSGYAQNNPASSLNKKDSLEILNELMSLLDSSDKPTSYIYANIGIGNRLFSVKNAALNAKQGSTNKVIYSPAMAYFHKSGLGFTAGANILNDVNGLDVNQYSATPSYDLIGNKNISFGLSYTHYFVKDKFSSFSSPIQNDFYASLSYKRTWLRPGLALGYSTGEYNDTRYKDTVIAGIRRHFYDSVNFKLNAFSMMVSASHQFTWYSLFSKSDGLICSPTLMANAGSGKTTITHTTNALVLLGFLTKRGRVPKLQNDTLELQSLGCNLNLNYSIGHLTLEPQLYVDYYLPATDSKRFTQVFSVNVGYTF